MKEKSILRVKAFTGNTLRWEVAIGRTAPQCIPVVFIRLAAVVQYQSKIDQPESP